ncbi:MAG: hypothetical protein LH479_07365 [Polaromonas sp.]|nr:hypothetical protein [Polaromonas sp.]
MLFLVMGQRGQLKLDEFLLRSMAVRVLARIDRALLLVDLVQFKVGQDISAPTGGADAPKKR